MPMVLEQVLILFSQRQYKEDFVKGYVVDVKQSKIKLVEDDAPLVKDLHDYGPSSRPPRDLVKEIDILKARINILEPKYL